MPVLDTCAPSAEPAVQQVLVPDSIVAQSVPVLTIAGTAVDWMTETGRVVDKMMIETGKVVGKRIAMVETVVDWMKMGALRRIPD